MKEKRDLKLLDEVTATVVEQKVGQNFVTLISLEASPSEKLLLGTYLQFT